MIVDENPASRAALERQLRQAAADGHADDVVLLEPALGAILAKAI